MSNWKSEISAKNVLFSSFVLCLSILSSGVAKAASEKTPEQLCSSAQIIYKIVEVDGIHIFYREAGPIHAPVVLFLHGFPSSSRMFHPLLSTLGCRYHLFAPDYPGFGHSDTPDAKSFVYTFDHLSTIIEHFTDRLALSLYTLFLQDYGGPVGFRLAVRHPERVQALIIQNAVAHESGLSNLWEKRRAFWQDRKSNEAAVRANFLSLDAARQRHVGTDLIQKSSIPTYGRMNMRS